MCKILNIWQLITKLFYYAFFIYLNYYVIDVILIIFIITCVGTMGPKIYVGP